MEIATYQTTPEQHGFCNNYQQERGDLVEWIDSVNKIIKDIK